MVFTSSAFVFLFLPFLLVTYYLFYKRTYVKNIILCIASLLFYAWGEPVIVFLMILSILVNYLFGLCMSFKNKKVFLVFSVVYNLSYLFVFKYFDFTSDLIGSLLHINTVKLNMTLPIGISFYTFQIMSYVIDVYRGDAKPQKNVVNLALYISLFSQLIAGPIVRYNTIEHDILYRKENLNMFRIGVERFMIGFSKKLIIANNVGFIVDKIYSFNSNELTTAFLWLAAIAYTLQIYFDFSAYSDMAIGLGKMFGFNFEENFNYPYIANSVTDFWRRWHISLSAWFKDYLYIPLGGNRVSKKRHIFNLFFTWFCTGLWHGANITFIVWGLYFFVFLILEKYCNFTKILRAFSHVYTLIIVIVSWVIFRAENMGLAAKYLKGMFAFDFDSFLANDFAWYIQNFGVILIVAIIFCMPVAKHIKRFLQRVPVLYEMGLAAMFLVAVSFMFRSTYNPFIYFNF